jgi:histidine phosphotransfer protein HptB
MQVEWERVAGLRDEIGAEALEEVVGLFLEEADEVIARLTGEAGAKALESDLHFLKGAALNLGFAEFASLCQLIERRAAAGEARNDLGPVRASYFASKQELLAGLDKARVA